MEIKQQIQNNVKEFLKSGDNLASGALRMVLSAIISKEKEKRFKVSKEKPNSKEQDLIKESELTDEEIIGVLLSEIKKRKDAIVLYEKGNRQELADKEKKEIEILKKYLPKQLSEEELRKLIQESIDKITSKEIHPTKFADEVSGALPETKQFNRVKDIGKVMADLMPKVSGRADSGEIIKIIKDILSKN